MLNYLKVVITVIITLTELSLLLSSELPHSVVTTLNVRKILKLVWTVMKLFKFMRNGLAIIPSVSLFDGSLYLACIVFVLLLFIVLCNL